MEETIQFLCRDKRLYGVLHLPDIVSRPSIIVIMLTGGPQVRAGAHRLYVQLSRTLCKHGWPSLRFDCEGMGDSEGNYRGFQYAEDSIKAAVEFLCDRFGRKIEFVFWSLCDGATAATLYNVLYPGNIKWMILCNPLVVTEQGLARSFIRHYYLRRFFEKEFLWKLVSLRLNIKDSFVGFWEYLRSSLTRSENHSNRLQQPENTLPKLVFDSLGNSSCHINVILSSDDIVASNFQDELNKSGFCKFPAQKRKLDIHWVEKADHTFVDPQAREKLFQLTLEILEKIRVQNLSLG